LIVTKVRKRGRDSAVDSHAMVRQIIFKEVKTRSREKKTEVAVM
jgi:hypothetical protein